jgi:uncharacterized membrane protein
MHSHGHGHGHSHAGLVAAPGEGPAPRRSGRQRRQEQRVRRRALVLMAVVLVPFALATIAGIVAYWPDSGSKPPPPGNTAFSAPGVSFPQGTVTGVKPVPCETGSAGGNARGNEPPRTCGQAAVRVESGPDQGRVQNVLVPAEVFRAGIESGDEIRLVRLPAGAGVEVSYQFLDFVRDIPVMVLAVAFAVTVVAVARLRGFAALIGLALACLVLGKFMLPALLAGEPGLPVGLVGSAAIMIVVLYLAHGVSARTTTALLGTLFGLLAMAGLGTWAADAARLTGMGSEDNVSLATVSGDVRLSGVVLCGLLIAGMGVLNDVTITQASAVWELYETAPATPASRLFAAAMRIGRDHIASTVYTISFAYVGAALPVLLLVSATQQSTTDALLSEGLAEEMVRTLVGSIGLVLAIPLTTLIAVAVVVSVSRGSGAEETAGGRGRWDGPGPGVARAGAGSGKA